MSIHPIEAESYRILAGRVDLSGFGPLAAAVVARVIHASADLEYAETMVVDQSAVEAGVAALRQGAPVLADVEMVRQGIPGVAVECGLGDYDAMHASHGVQATQAGHGVQATQAGHGVQATQAGHGVQATQAGHGVQATQAGPTRSAGGIRVVARRHPVGAVVVIGCAPTALDEVLRLHAEEGFAPALVVGLPVGFVGAADAKHRLRESGLATISNVGDKGGSAVAAAAANAMVRLAAGG